MSYQELGTIIVGALMGLLLYLLAGVARRAAELAKEYLLKKKAEAEAGNKKALAASFSFAAAVLDAITKTVVADIEHTKAYHIRQAVKAGEAASEELELLSTEAYNKIINQLKPGVKTALDDCLEDTEQYIRQHIEEVLPEIKGKYLETKSKEAMVQVNGENTGH